MHAYERPAIHAGSGAVSLSAISKFQSIDLLLLTGKHDDFIKISYCIFKIHKPSMKLFYVK